MADYYGVGPINLRSLVGLDTQATAQQEEQKQQGLFGDSIDAAQMGAANALGGILDFAGAEGMARSFYGIADDQINQMSDSGREAMQKELITRDEQGDLALGDGATDLDTWILQFANLVGNAGATMVPGGLAVKGLKLGTAGAATAFGITGGSAATGMAAEQGRDEIRNMSPELLAKSPKYAEIRQMVEDQYGQEDDQTKDAITRESIAEMVAGEIKSDPKQLAVNFAGSALADPIIGRALTGARIAKSGIKASALRGAAVEGLTEAGQAGVSQYGINEVLQPYDSRGLYEGVTEAALSEGILAGTFGATAGAFGGAVDRKANNPAPEITKSKGLNEAIGSLRNTVTDAAIDVAPAAPTGAGPAAPISTGGLYDVPTAAPAARDFSRFDEPTVTRQSSGRQMGPYQQAQGPQPSLDTPTIARDQYGTANPMTFGRVGDNLMFSESVGARGAQPGMDTELDSLIAKAKADAEAELQGRQEDEASAAVKAAFGDVADQFRQINRGTSPVQQSLANVGKSPTSAELTAQTMVDARQQQADLEGEEAAQATSAAFADAARTVKMQSDRWQKRMPAVIPTAVEGEVVAPAGTDIVPAGDRVNWEDLKTGKAAYLRESDRTVIAGQDPSFDPNAPEYKAPQPAPKPESAPAGFPAPVDSRGQVRRNGDVFEAPDNSGVKVRDSGKPFTTAQQALRSETAKKMGGPVVAVPFGDGGFGLRLARPEEIEAKVDVVDEDGEAENSYTSDEGAPLVEPKDIPTPPAKPMSTKAMVTRSASYKKAAQWAADKDYVVEPVQTDEGWTFRVKKSEPTVASAPTRVTEITPEWRTSKAKDLKTAAQADPERARVALRIPGKRKGEPAGEYRDRLQKTVDASQEILQLSDADIDGMNAQDMTRLITSVGEKPKFKTAAKLAPAVRKIRADIERNLKFSENRSRFRTELTSYVKEQKPVPLSLLSEANQYDSADDRGISASERDVYQSGDTAAAQALGLSEVPPPNTNADVDTVAAALENVKAKFEKLNDNDADEIGRKIADYRTDTEARAITPDQMVKLGFPENVKNSSALEKLARSLIRDTSRQKQITEEVNDFKQAEQDARDRKMEGTTVVQDRETGEYEVTYRGEKVSIYRDNGVNDNKGWWYRLPVEGETNYDTRMSIGFNKADAVQSVKEFIDGRLAKAETKVAPKAESADPLTMTPAQFVDAEIRETAARNDVSLAEAREYADIDGIKTRWLRAIRTAISEQGFTPSNLQLDRIAEMGDQQVSQVLRLLDTAGRPVFYQPPSVRAEVAAAAEFEKATAFASSVEAQLRSPEFKNRTGEKDVLKLVDLVKKADGNWFAVQGLLLDQLPGTKGDVRNSLVDRAMEIVRAAIDTLNAPKVAKSAIIADKPEFGLSSSRVMTIVDEQLAKIGGTGGIKVKVVLTQAEFEKILNLQAGENVKGFYNPATKEVVLIAENLSNATDVKRTLLHELLAHGGLDMVIGRDATLDLLDLISRTRDKAAFKDLWDWVDRNYKGLDDIEKSEEIFARFTETAPEAGSIQYWWNSIVNKLRRILNDLGLWTSDMTKADMQDTLDAIVRGFRESKAPAKAQAGNTEIRFSKTAAGSYDTMASPEVDRILKTAHSGILAKAKAAFTSSTLVDKARANLTAFLTLGQLAETSKDMFNNGSFDKYHDTYQQYIADVQGAATDASILANEVQTWAQQNQEQAQTMYELAHDATVFGADADPDVGDVTPLPLLEERLVALREDLSEAQTQGLTARVKDLRKAIASTKAEIKDFDEGFLQRRVQLRERFVAMSPDAQKYYRTLRKAYEDRRNSAYSFQKKELTAAAQEAKDAGNSAAYRSAKKALERLLTEQRIAQMSGPYFPLTRYGEYFVDLTDPQGERVFLMQETKAEMETAVAAFEKEGWTITKKGKIAELAREDGISGEILDQLGKIVDNSGLENDQADALRDQVYQLYLQYLPSRSIRKNLIHRKGVKGFDQDAVRAFAHSMSKSSNQIARMKHLPAFTKALREAAAQVRGYESDGVAADAAKSRELLEELRKRHEYIMNPDESKTAQAITGLGFTWLLGLSPAAAAINLTQTATVAAPVMAAKLGISVPKALAILTGNLRELRMTKTPAGERLVSLRDTLTDPAEKSAYRELERMGIIDMTRAHDLVGISETGGFQYGGKFHKAMAFVSKFFHNAEVINREITSMAVYRLAKQQGKTHAEAVKIAADITRESHFDYSSGNRARFMQGNFAKVAFQFKQYSQQMSYFLIRNTLRSLPWNKLSAADRKIARTQLLGTLMTTGVLGGIAALPTGLIYALVNAVVPDDDDEVPFDAKQELYTFLAQNMGKEVANKAIYGVGGAGLSSRIQLNELWLRDPAKNLESSEAYSNYIMQLLGPAFGGIFPSMVKGADLLAEGEYQKGVEKMVPKALKDISVAQRYADEGATTMRGDVLKEDFTYLSLFLQANGLQDSEVAARYEENAALKGVSDGLKKRRQSLMDRYYEARVAQDSDEMAEVTQAISKFNQKNPDIRISTKNLTQSYRTRTKRTEATTNGLYLDKDLRYLQDKIDWL